MILLLTFLGETSPKPWTGAIICNSRNGLYPAAVFHEPSGRCGFNETSNFTSIAYMKNFIIRAMKQAHFKVHSPPCDGIRCDVGKCLKNSSICDGFTDCRDKLDEISTVCDLRSRSCSLSEPCTCKKSELRCNNGLCVRKSSFCDGRNDCGDWSDEPDRCTCKSYLAMTEPEKICDGTRNCYDRTDEDPKVCKCKNVGFNCGRSDYCIPIEMVCDKHEDCPDGGSDEEDCMALRSPILKSNVGEVMKRTAGVWHSACYEEHISTSHLENICRRLGFSGTSASRWIPTNDFPKQNASFPKLDKFKAVRIHRHDDSSLYLAMRSGQNQFVTLGDNSKCQRLFIQCL